MEAITLFDIEIYIRWYRFHDPIGYRHRQYQIRYLGSSPMLIFQENKCFLTASSSIISWIKHGYSLQQIPADIHIHTRQIKLLLFQLSLSLSLMGEKGEGWQTSEHLLSTGEEVFYKTRVITGFSLVFIGFIARNPCIRKKQA